MIKQIEEAVKIDAVYFPDGVFRDYITKNFDKDNDGFLSRHEIEEARVLDLSFNNYITSLQGIELLSNLEYLVIYKTKIKEFDTSGNHSLKYLDCSNTKIKRLDIFNTHLYHLDCSNTKIKKLDIHSSNLSYLDCSNTNIKELNLSKSYSLRELHCEHTEIKELDITNINNLCYLSCDNIKIEDINFYNSNLMSCLNYLICNGIKFKRFNFSNNYETDKKPLLNSQKLVKREGLEDCSLLRPGHLTMIAGAGGTGKTTLALNIAHNIAYNMSLPTLIISEEKPKEALVNRLILMKYGVRSHLSHIPPLSELGWHELTKEVLLNKKLHLIIDDRPGMSIQELQNKCKKYKDKYGIRLIIIDYLQLLEPAYKSHSRKEEQANIIRDLKHLANELNIPIIIFSNLSRAALYRHVPILSDLCFPKNYVINYIDEIIFILDHDVVNRLNKELIVIQKNGLLGRVKLKWLPEYLKYIY